MRVARGAGWALCPVDVDLSPINTNMGDRGVGAEHRSLITSRCV